MSPIVDSPDRGHRGGRTARILIAAGVLLLVAACAWQLYATLWTLHSEHAGKALVHNFLQQHDLTGPVGHSAQPVGTTTLAACRTDAKRPGGLRRSVARHGATPVRGLLEIPKLGVVAPVEQGTGDAQLAVAVGHNPDSVWPGRRGNAVLYAHDVTYFTSLPDLKSGDEVTFVTPCTTYTFTVTAHAVVRQGSPVYNTTTPTITLVTCWPTDALWFTPDRYLVTALEVSKHATARDGTAYASTGKAPSVPIPPALSSQGVTLATYSMPMGTLTLTGSPDPAWAQTSKPLLAAASGVEDFIAGVRALTEDHLDWWQDLAPGVPPPQPLVGAANPGYEAPTEVAERTAGTTLESVTLSDVVSVSGGKAPGRYTMTVEERLRDGKLVVSSWTLTPD